MKRELLLIHFLVVLFVSFIVPAYPQGGRGDWVEATSAAAWGQRFGQSAVVHQGRIWTIGGDHLLPAAEVFSSPDGKSWTSVPLMLAPWSWRGYHASVVYDGKMWLLGGGESPESDVWYSSDGLKWTSATRHAAWGRRRDHAAVVHNGKMWVLGGPYLNDVWYSTDGAKWTSATLAAAWPAQKDLAAVSFLNKLWVINGLGVWCTSDGANWTTATTPAPWGGPYYPYYYRSGMKAVVCAGRIWVMGGVYPHVGSYSDVWSSSDGKSWVRVTSAAGWRPRTGHAVVVHDGKIWILGGEYVDSKNAYHIPLSDVWYTAMPTAVHPWRLYP